MPAVDYACKTCLSEDGAFIAMPANSLISTILQNLSVAFLIPTFWLSSAAGQEPLTGTRLNTAGTGNPRTVIRLQEPDEVKAIERLLLSGEEHEALSRALQYVEQADNAALDAQTRYFAHNSLCVVYTKLRRDSEAETECSTAIELMPGHWSGWNNRGTLRYLQGNYREAQEDYRRALEHSANREAIVDLLTHNLRLVELRLRPLVTQDPQVEC
jgi:tetratricopeptide (TPR) repeat protein